MAHCRLGDINQAIEYHKQHLAIAKELGDMSDERNAYHILGSAYEKLGDFNQAIEYHKQHLNIVKQLGDRACEGHAYNNLGMAYRELGDISQAIAYHRQALSIAKEQADRTGEDCAYKELGSAYGDLGDSNQAIEYHRQNRNIAKELGDRARVGGAYIELGKDYYELGDHNQAIKYAKSCRDITQDPEAKLSSLDILSSSYFSLGKLLQAKEFSEEMIDLAKVNGNRNKEADAYSVLGMVYARRDHFKLAKEYLEKAHAIANGTNVMWAISDFFFQKCEFGRAMEYHKKARNLSQKTGDELGEGISFFNMGFIFESVGNLHEAVDCYQRSIKLFNQLRILQGEDELKITFRNAHKRSYDALWRTLLKLSKFDEALCVADRGRAQALLVSSSYDSAPNSQFLDQLRINQGTSKWSLISLVRRFLLHFKIMQLTCG